MSVSSFSIRQATLADLPNLVELFEGYRTYYKQSSAPEEATEFLRQRLTNDESVIYAAEQDNGQLGGFTQLYPLFSSTRMKRVWLLNDLFVSPEYRGLGLSVRLIEEAKSLVRKTKALGMYLETQTSNEIGNQLYPRAGFTLVTAANYYEWMNDSL